EYDTCESIGQPWGLSGNDILAANSFLNCADIWPGTPICIPSLQPTVTTLSVVPRCQQTYTSVEKDTCSSIGTHFGVSGNDIYQANTFLDCNDIWPYTPICIPYPASTISTPTSTPTPSSFPTCPFTVRSLEGDTCNKLAERHKVSSWAIQYANPFLNCNDIWTNTPICLFFHAGDVPTTTPTPTDGSCTYVSSTKGQTCAILGVLSNLMENDIYLANDFLDCNNIWPNTPICIPKTPRNRSACKHIFLIEDWLASPGPFVTPENVARLWGTSVDDIRALSGDGGIGAGTLFCIPWSSPY
ncbi:hypothetical protein FRC17_003523, partial [Serendipita sp. 399]